MKKNPSLYGLLITLGIVVMCYFIYVMFLEKKDSYLLTNPSEHYLEVKIDDKDYKLAPQQITAVKIQGGEHSLKYSFNGKVIDTIFTITRGNAVINPTQADYYVFVRPYGGGRNVDSLFSAQTVTIGEKVYNGNITHYKDIYIEDFYYNLDDKFPKVFIKKGEEANDLSKIFSKEDFQQFYFENYE